jgi:hypothetical protein
VKPGDIVRVVALSPRVPDNLESKLVFERSVGHTFPVIDIADDGLVELEVGGVMSVSPYMHSIWIEPECLEVVQARSAP